MRTCSAALVVLLALACGACSRQDERQAGRDARATDRKIEEGTSTAARKLGKAAYKISEETKIAAKKAGRELRQASHEAHEGWKEEKQKERAKGKP